MRMVSVAALLLLVSSEAGASALVEYKRGDVLNTEVLWQYREDAGCQVNCTQVLRVAGGLYVYLHYARGNRIHSVANIEAEFAQRFIEKPSHDIADTFVTATVVKLENDKPCATDCWLEVEFSHLEGRARLYANSEGESERNPRQGAGKKTTSSHDKCSKKSLLPTDPGNEGSWGPWQAPPANIDIYEADHIDHGFREGYEFFTWWYWQKQCLRWECEDHAYPSGITVRICRQYLDNC